MKTKYQPVNYPGGISMQWSPVNQAYFVMWHNQVLRVIPAYDEALAYVRGLIAPLVEG